MGNAINVITAIKTKHEKSPQLRVVSFVLLFADGALGFWYIKAKQSLVTALNFHLSKFSEVGKRSGNPSMPVPCSDTCIFAICHCKILFPIIFSSIKK